MLILNKRPWEISAIKMFNPKLSKKSYTPLTFNIKIEFYVCITHKFLSTYKYNRTSFKFQLNTFIWETSPRHFMSKMLQ